MTNPITINPAIAVVRKVDNVSLVYRNQWVGLEGSPVTSALSYQGVFFEDRVGLGANLVHDRIGPVVQTGLYFDYSYDLLLDDEGNKRLSLGLKGGFNFYNYNLLNLRYGQPDNDITLDGKNTKFLPNFGVGLFYYTDNFFFGASVPKLLRNSLDDMENTLTSENKEERHYFFMTGYILPITDNIDFKPSAILRMVSGAPVSLDLTATIMLYDRIWVGGMYSLRNSFGGLARIQISPRFHFGYSVDFSNNRLRAYNNGSHEIFMSYDFVANDVINSIRRYF
jgi:type IX secretion system PorP/SprF family membrane protein